MFRICACLPVALRLFVVHCRRELIRVDFVSLSFLHNIMNEFVFTLSAVEFFSMAIFSIVSIRKDSIEVHRYCKVTFAIAASANMLITSVVMAAHKRFSRKRLDSISIMGKILSTIAFSRMMSRHSTFNAITPTFHSICAIHTVSYSQKWVQLKVGRTFRSILRPSFDPLPLQRV
ncbi:hypothetical protein COOONC_27101 [Cooperia oncophora]